MNPMLLTPVEAARALGIGRSKMYELISSGLVESVLIGSARRIPVDALATYVAYLRAARAATGTAPRATGAAAPVR